MINQTLNRLKCKIKKLIKNRNISIYVLANRADVSDTCIRNWFSKRDYTPSLYTLIKVCEVLGVTLSELFIEENEELYPINEELKTLISEWQKLDNYEKDAVLTHIKSYRK